MKTLNIYILFSGAIMILAYPGLFAQSEDGIDPSEFLTVRKYEQSLTEDDSTVYVTILNRELNDKPVSTLLPGYLFEMGYGDMESGLWAEMIFNRQFEPFPPYGPNRDWWYGLRKRDEIKGRTDLLCTDWREMDWYHSGYEHNIWYAAPGDVNDFHINEESTFFQLENSQGTAKIELLEEIDFMGQFVRVMNVSSENGQGIAQNGKFIRRGKGYTFKGYFRKVNGENEVSVLLYPQGQWDEPVACIEIDGLTNKWEQKTIHFSRLDYEGFVTLAILLKAYSAIDMDGLSFMPDDAVNGWRRDVIEMVRDEIRPGVIRWPGGCYASYYQWTDGIGPPDFRPVGISYHWGGFACNDVGTIEYVDFCRKIGAEPFICLNVFHPMKEKYLHYTGDEGTNFPHGHELPEFTVVEEGAILAAEWVAYCNLKPGEHPMADLRVKHGCKDPLNVKYWELDNEAWRWFRTAEEYARACVIYSRAMKVVDPDIELGICTYGKPLSDGLDTLLEIAGKYIDFLADRALLTDEIDRKKNIILDYNRKHNTDIRYTNTEYFVEIYDQVIANALVEINVKEGRGRNLATATWGYSLSWANLLMQWQRYGGDVMFTCFNSFANDHLNSVIETPKEGVFLKYPAVIGKLFRESPARWLLDLEGYEPDIRKNFQVQVAWDIDRKNLVIYLYNSNPDKRQVSLDFNELNASFKHIKATYIIGPDLAAIRSVKQPNEMVEAQIVFEDMELNDGIWTTWAPPGSFVQIELLSN
jgi:alpha-L-arabinofuranosidase